ncbi:MAG: tetratricopeptide repeat protein [Deltaproteobacteria bacterium]|nr:tetratricopeptide repeat protein [Deltaproteobacteria bacterium]
MRRTRLTLIAALAAAACLSSPLTVRAEEAKSPDPKVIEKAKEHFATGKKQYDAGDRKAAVESFKEAYKLTRNPLLLYNIGFVYDELRDKALAVHYYDKFLSDAPNNERTQENRALASERSKALKKEITEEESAAPAEGPEQAPAPTPATPEKQAKSSPSREEASAKSTGKKKNKRTRVVTEFSHEIVEAAPPGKPLDMTAMIPEEEDWVLTLYHRAAGQDEFVSTRMKPRYHEMVARIPAKALKEEGSIQYYIEARDASGKVVASSGRASSPNLVMIEAGSKPHYFAVLSEEPTGMVGEETAGEGPRDEDPDDQPADLEEQDDHSTTAAVGGADSTKTLWYAKWATTGSAAVFLSASMLFSISATRYADRLEEEARLSANPPHGCNTGDPPCTAYGDYQKDLEKTGKSYETWSNVSLIAGAASAVAAGTLWYLEWKGMRKDSPRGKKRNARGKDQVEEARARASLPAVRAAFVPVVGDTFVGGAAFVEF